MILLFLALFLIYLLGLNLNALKGSTMLGYGNDDGSNTNYRCGSKFVKSGYLRVQVANQLVEWGLCEWDKDDRPAYTLLRKLLGYANHREMIENFTQDDFDKCQKLLGVHGYCIYKMLEARK
jgi:hypothetical protein